MDIMIVSYEEIVQSQQDTREVVSLGIFHCYDKHLLHSNGLYRLDRLTLMGVILATLAVSRCGCNRSGNDCAIADRSISFGKKFSLICSCRVKYATQKRPYRYKIH